MLSLIFLSSVLAAVDAVANPASAPTAAAVLEPRQAVLNTVWSPTLVGTTLSYASYSCSSGQSLSASNGYWRCCPSGACAFATLCSAGIVYFPGTSIPCSSVDTAATLCGTEWLFSTAGAPSGLKKLFCGAPTDTLTQNFFLVSPTASTGISTTAPTTSPTTPTPTAPTPTPTNSPSSTPVGAIVGGVVGGLAVLAIAAVGIFFLLRKRKNSAQPTQPSPPVAPVQPPPPAMAGTYENKHASYAETYAPGPASPPPMYQNTAQQGYYPPTGMTENKGLVGGAPVGSPSTSPPGMAPAVPVAYQQPQYGVPQQGMHSGPIEMEAHSAAPSGAVELSAEPTTAPKTT